MDLRREFSRRRNCYGRDVVLLGRLVDAEDSRDHGNEEGEGLATAGDGFNYHTAENQLRKLLGMERLNSLLVRHEEGQHGRLHRRHAREAHAGDGIEDPFRQRRRKGVPSSGVLLRGWRFGLGRHGR